jgi:4-amino-4-deoxy-L-arabinose transferase-like glycosyltransferase
MSAIALPAPAETAPEVRPQAHQGRVRRLFRGRLADPAWVRPALLGLLVATGALYLWDLSASGWANSFYAAAVEAGSKSWKAFFFGSFDSSNFITVDKSPASLWVMDLSARLFGVNSWSILVPNALEGVATVGVLYLTVRRWFSPAAALAAGTVVALTPVAALMFRFNNPDAFLVLLLTVAAYATVRTIERGNTGWIALAGALVGFGFLAKMLQAFLVVPGIGLAYMVAAPGTMGRRIRQVAIGAAALVAAAGWWVLAVQLMPAADRPYIGGSQNNSLWNLIFGYNGFGRLTGNETGSVGGAARGGQWGVTGLTRLFGADMGSQISWLLPAALVLLVAGLVLGRRARRTDRTRAALILWGGWLVVSGLAFSLGRGIIHPYYTVALAPAIGAVVAVGGSAVWRRRHEAVGRGLMSAVVAMTALWSWTLMGRSPGWMPELRGLVVAVGVAAAVAILVMPWLERWARGAVLAAAILAALAGPAAYTLDTVATPHTGAIPSAGPAITTSGGGPFAAGGGRGFRPGFGQAGNGQGPSFGGAGPAGAGGTAPAPGAATGAAGNGGPGRGPAGGTGGPGNGGGLLDASKPATALVRYLDTGAHGYRWVLATVGANEAAGYQLSTGKAVMAIGGFNGTDPTPTLAAFEKLVAAHQIHYFITGGVGGAGGPGGAGGTSSDASAITEWVEAHFPTTTVGGATVYDLSSARSSSG